MAGDCGLGPWRPAWLARFATYHTFLVVYGLLGSIQSMSFIYFVATLTTFEKRFKIPSRTTGLVMCGNEVSQILLSLYLSYHGGRGNRPLWIAAGVALSAASCLIMALPHAVYGAGEDALALTVEHLDTSKLLNGSYSADEAASLCSGERPPASCGGEWTVMPVVIVFLSQFVLGIGTTLYYALGATYLDDNTKKAHTPMLLGLMLSFRSIGPALGFVIGFGFLSLYIDPTLTPVIDKKDPRWLGAWWLGWILLGLVMFVLAILIALFPKKLPPRRPTGSGSARRHTVQRSKSAQGQIAVSRVKERQPLTKYMLDDFLPSARVEDNEKMDVDASPPSPPPVKMTKDTLSKALLRLLQNKLLMLNTVSAVFYILGASGYITFLTKYMEVQFHKSAAGANIFGGAGSILAMVGGFLISGVVISRCKPAPRKLLAWNVLIGGVYVLGEFALIFTGCPNGGLQGSVVRDGRLHLSTICNSACNCELAKYSPVCHEELSQTYFSACHAGCGTARLNGSSTQSFTNCSCLSEPRTAFTSLILDRGLTHAIAATEDMPLSFESTSHPPTDTWKTPQPMSQPTSTAENYTKPVHEPSTTAPPESSSRTLDQSPTTTEPDNDTSSILELSTNADTNPPTSEATPTEASSSGPSEAPAREAAAIEGQATGEAGAHRSRRTPVTVTVTAGPCFVDCATSLYWFLGITCFMHALGSSGKIGNVLVNYRCVSTEDKSFAQGLGLLAISLFAFIPGPIIYGNLIDSTCLVWDESCGNQGNCWIYNTEDFRYYLNVTAICFTTVATFFDGLVWYYGKDLDLYGEPDEPSSIEN